jgi:arsenate reductase-like glutaredoxin family protein
VIASYRNPACGTSRSAPTLHRNSCLEPKVIKYLKAAPRWSS